MLTSGDCLSVPSLRVQQSVLIEICRPESQQRTTNIRCLTSQKSDILNYSAAKNLNLQFYDILSVLKLIIVRRDVRKMAV